MSAVSSVSLGLRSIALHAFTGEVVNASRSVETRTVREVDSGRVLNQQSFAHLGLSVRAPDGEVRSIGAGSADVSAEPGQTVTLFWGIIGRNAEGDYFAVHNHDTGETGFIPAGVNDLAGPPLYNLMIIVIVFVVVANFMGSIRGDSGAYLLVALALGAFWWIIGRRRKLRAAARKAAAAIGATLRSARIA